MNKTSEQLWGDVKDVRRVFGISRSVCYRLMGEGRIKHSSLVTDGARGKRMIFLPSVAAFLESKAEGGAQ